MRQFVASKLIEWVALPVVKLAKRIDPAHVTVKIDL